jgi:hypothetical protein
VAVEIAFKFWSKIGGSSLTTLARSNERFGNPLLATRRYFSSTDSLTAYPQPFKGAPIVMLEQETTPLIPSTGPIRE